MKPRNTVALVIIAHVGLFLIWMCMGGCSVTRQDKTVEDIRPQDLEMQKPTDIRAGITETQVPVVETRRDPVITRPPDPRTTVVTTKEYDDGEEEVYVVKAGDSLWKISKTFNVSQEAIIERNDIQNPAMLREGRKLYIPKKGGSGTAKPPVTTSTATETETTATETTTGIETGESTTTPDDEGTAGRITTVEDTTPIDESQYDIHEVVAGDTLWKLSQTYGVRTEDIMRVNNIDDPKKLQIGQKLKIPKTK